MSFKSKLVKLGGAAIIAAMVTGCAHSPNDPLEGYNRQAYYFTEAVDTVVVKPIAYGYHGVLPETVQTMVSNFFSNIADVWIAFNNFLQGRGDEGFSDVSRVMVNTFAGIGGLIDVASQAGLPKHNEDFGQTLGVWGVPSGPYFFIPILGPSTIRDTAAAPADYWFGDPVTYIQDEPIKWGLVALRGISKRAELIDATSVIDDAAIDKYEFIRDAYLQRRQRMVHDKDLDNEQWETIDENEKQMQPWLPSSEIKQDKQHISPKQQAAEVKAAPVVENKAANTAVEKNEQTQAFGPVATEAATKIN